MKWLFHNQGNDNRCELVTITPKEDEFENYEEFPDDPLLSNFDPSDRKFVAVAINSDNAPSIYNAVDSDWWHSRKPLHKNGINIVFLCKNHFDDNA